MSIVMYIAIGFAVLWYMGIILVELKGRREKKNKKTLKKDNNLQNFGTFVDNLENEPEINLMEELEKDVQESSLLDAFTGDSELENENNNPKSLNYDVEFKIIKKEDDSSSNESSG